MPKISQYTNLSDPDPADLVPTVDVTAGETKQSTWAQVAASDAFTSQYQPLDSDLTSIAALTTTATGRSLLAAADAAAIRTIAGVTRVDEVFIPADVLTFGTATGLTRSDVNGTPVILLANVDTSPVIATFTAATLGASHWNTTAGSITAQAVISPTSSDANAVRIAGLYGNTAIGAAPAALSPTSGANNTLSGVTDQLQLATALGTWPNPAATDLTRYAIRRLGANAGDTSTLPVTLWGLMLRFIPT